MKLNRSAALRAGIVQLVAVGVLALISGLLLPHSAFVDFGWIIGPLAWMVAATVTALAVHLPLPPAWLGAVLAGIPSAIATVIGAHWLGAVLAIICFSLWCGGLAARRIAAEAI
ncbi:MAG: hypothetical protein WCK97_02685 [Actinomycetes bacterium]